ncbi:hypothetical protein JCM11641_005186 [Rhodosporidiobolus odoratus]
MASTSVPFERPSSPRPADNASAPTSPSSKLPRLDLPTDGLDPSSIGETLTSKGRRPKQVIQADPTRPKEPQELRGTEEALIEQRLEVDDAAGYPDGLLSIQTFLNRLHYPTRTQIRMLLSLCLFPLLYKPPTKSSNPSFAPGVRSTSTVPQPSTALFPESDDPLSPSYQSVRAQALLVLQSVIGTNGMEIVCRAIRGSGLPETRLERLDRQRREEEARQAAVKQHAEIEAKRAQLKAEGKKLPPIRKAAPRLVPDLEGSEDEDDLRPADEDEPIMTAAKRIGKAEDLWDFLAGTTARKGRLRSRENVMVEGGGWALFGVMVDGWETEHDRKNKVPEDPPAPISLIRYFKPSASSSTSREVSPKALDLVFWPFSEYGSAKKLADGEDEEDEDMSNGGSEAGQGKKESEIEGDDGMQLEDKRVAAVRLLGLMGRSAMDGWLSGSALLTEIVQRMRLLQPEDFTAFVELLASSSLASAFVLRLFTTYLESTSHPPTYVSDIVTLPLATTLAASSTQTSPRKRAMNGNSSFASVASDSPSHSSAGAAAVPSPSQLRAAFWRSPSIRSQDFLPLLARIPIEVPLEPPAPAAGETSGNSRRPKLNLPATFARAQAAVDAQRVIKEALLGLVDAREQVGEGRKGECAEMLRKVEEKVEGARRKVERR